MSFTTTFQAIQTEPISAWPPETTLPTRSPVEGGPSPDREPANRNFVLFLTALCTPFLVYFFFYFKKSDFKCNHVTGNEHE